MRQKELDSSMHLNALEGSNMKFRGRLYEIYLLKIINNLYE